MPLKVIMIEFTDAGSALEGLLTINHETVQINK